MAQLLPTARDHLRRIFLQVSEVQLLSAVPLRGALVAVEVLGRRGIELSASGGLATGSEPRLDLTKRFTSIAGVMRTITKELARQDREATLAELTEKGWLRSAARIRSSGGGTG